MAIPTTWTLLKAELADWLNRTDLTDPIVNFIVYAENRFNRELFGPEREASTTLSASAETVALPADFHSIRSAYLSDSPRWTLQQVSLGDLRNLYPTSATGKPCHFAIVGSNMHLGPIPSSTQSIVLNYYEDIPTLSGSQATNWLLTAHPDLYVSASLVEAYKFLRDPDGMAIHEAETRRRIDEINKLGAKKRHGITPLAPASIVTRVSNFFSA